MVNRTKVTLRNAFIDNLFALESEKESKNEKRALFTDCVQIVVMNVKP